MRGDIAELIIYNHTLTSEEANQVGNYLADKYAVGSAYVDATIIPQAKIYDFGLPGNPAIINGNDITWTVPFLTDAANLAPTYMISAGATCDKASGSTQNFTTPQTYTVTSSDSATTNVYTVTVIVRPALINYDFNSGLQGWTQIWPAAGNGNVLENGALGSGGDDGDTRFARSPEFILHGLADLTFQLDGGESPLSAPGVGPSAIPEIALTSAGFAGVALRDVAANTYVLSKRRSGNGGGWQNNSFTMSELAPYVHPRSGTRSTTLITTRAVGAGPTWTMSSFPATERRCGWKRPMWAFWWAAMQRSSSAFRKASMRPHQSRSM